MSRTQLNEMGNSLGGIDGKNPTNKYNEYLRSIENIEIQRKLYIANMTQKLFSQQLKPNRPAPAGYIGERALAINEYFKNNIDSAIQNSIQTAYGSTRPSPDGAYNRGINFDHIHKQHYAAKYGF